MLMKRIFFLIAAAFVLQSVLVAQNVLFKVGGGLASHYSSADPVGAYKIGVGYEWEFDQHFTFMPSIEFYGKGWKSPNEQVFVLDEAGNQRFDPDTGKPLTSLMNRSATANYLQVPLLFSYYWRTGERRYVVFSAGPYAAFGVAGKQKTKGDGRAPGTEKFYYEKKTFDEPGASRWDTGLQVMAGYQFPSSLRVGLEADFGFVKCTSNGGRNVSGLISLSYKL